MYVNSPIPHSIALKEKGEIETEAREVSVLVILLRFRSCLATTS